MARQSSESEFSSFVRGLITEASVMNFPENASVDEGNFVLKRDGSRSRRLGMSLEDGYQELDGVVRYLADGSTYVSSYNWDDASKDLSIEIAVVQIGAYLRFYDMSSAPISGNYIKGFVFPGYTEPSTVSYASVDGVLVVSYGDARILSYKYVNGDIEETSFRLKVRDLFGVDDFDLSGKDLREGNNLSFRPEEATQSHMYNLRNQGWGVPWRDYEAGTEILYDPIKIFRDYTGTEEVIEHGGGKDGEDIVVQEAIPGVYPANSDTISTGIFANADDGDDRVGDRFHATSVIMNPSASGGGVGGYFIIDLLNRGSSRLEAIAELKEKYVQIPGDGVTNITTLPSDYTSGGCTCVETYAGRVWYAGFGSEVTDGDTTSPQLSGYVLFSQLFSSQGDLAKCYQVADPTNYIDSDLVDTDGGFIRIDGVGTILSLKQLGPSLMVFADNGVWSISGGSGYGFTATDYVVSKITSAGLAGIDSLVVVEDGIMYWSEDGIYSLSKNEYGDYVSQSISKSTIQTMYNDIPFLDRYYAKGVYDSFNRCVYWMYNNRTNSSDDFTEIVLDIDLGAFYKNIIKQPDGCGWRPCAYLETPPYSVGSSEDVVTVNGDTVYVGSDEVVVTSRFSSSSVREVMYVTITGITEVDASRGNVSFTLSSYSDSSFTDWSDFDGVGVDAAAYLTTGYLMPGSSMRKKGVTYLGMHFQRTENGFEADDEGDLYPINQSSCLVRALWDWTNSANSNRWGRQFQAYRYRRMYMPEDVNDSYDTGYEVITTKNKLRGSGRAISLLIETEPKKDCKIIGWSMIGSISGNV